MISITQFLAAMNANPFLLVVMVLVMGTIFVNGATDAANAIASAVGTRSIGIDAAIVMSVVCNFVGLVAMSHISTAVADTISGMVDFGGDAHLALIALAAACVAIVVWGVGAWLFGIPSSQSHSLIAGLTGAAIAVHGGIAGINWGEWVKVIYGLFLSAALGFGGGWLITDFIQRTCRNRDRRRLDESFAGLQVFGAAFVALMHGAQDGQKFMSTAMLAIALSLNVTAADMGGFPIWIELACASAMAIGTAVGGKKIIKKVGMEMCTLEKYQGFAASLAAALALLAATLTGLPVSTTHTKTAAIMGSGAAKNVRSVKWGVAGDMALTWIFTFPGCGIIGFVLAKVFLLCF